MNFDQPPEKNITTAEALRAQIAALEAQIAAQEQAEQKQVAEDVARHEELVNSAIDQGGVIESAQQRAAPR